MGIVALIDRDGNDMYTGTGLCQGSATITSFAALVDGGGDDVFKATKKTVQGWGGHKQDSDRGTHSFGFLLNFGGTDKYLINDEPAPDRGENDVFLHTGKHKKKTTGYGILWDTKKKYR